MGAVGKALLCHASDRAVRVGQPRERIATNQETAEHVVNEDRSDLLDRLAPVRAEPGPGPLRAAEDQQACHRDLHRAEASRMDPGADDVTEKL
jgi:hypothetical protein